jgi:PAS domain S-box-containing protein
MTPRRPGITRPIADSGDPVTAKKRSGAATRSRNPESYDGERQLLAAIVDASHDAIYSWNTGGIITSWNAQAEQQFGYAADEIIGKSLLTLIPEDRLDRSRDAIEKLLHGEFYGQYETVRLRKDGVPFDVELTVSPIRDGSGAIVGVATVCRDITQRRQFEARLRLAIEAAQLGIWDWNVLTGDMVYSARAKEIYGFDADAPVTFAQVRRATHPEDAPITAELSRRARDPAIREKKPYEFRIIRPNGSIRWILAHGEAVFAPVEGKLRAIRYAGTLQDITEQKRTADALLRSNTRLRIAIEAGKMGVWEYKPETESLVGSPELNRVLGFPPDSTPSIEQIRAGYPPGEQERLREIAQGALAGGQQSFEAEYRYRWLDQSVHWLLVRAEFVFRDGKVNRLIGIVTDITQLKHAQEQQAFLINELNHRVKNTLATVQSLAVMTFKTKAPAEFADAFSRRLAALSATHDLLTSSGWEHAQLDDVIEAELKPYMSSQILLERSAPAILLSPKAALSLGLVFHELATNAAKHGALSQSSGRLLVKWQRTMRGGRQYLSIAWREQDGPAPNTVRTAGFGSRLIESSITDELGGEIALNYPPTGFHAEIALPMRDLGATSG